MARTFEEVRRDLDAINDRILINWRALQKAQAGTAARKLAAVRGDLLEQKGKLLKELSRVPNPILPR